LSERRLGRSIAARLERLDSEPRSPTQSRPASATPPPPSEPAIVSGTDPRRCSVCGTLNVPGEAFCANCGNFLEWSGDGPSDSGSSASVDSPGVAAPKQRTAPPEPARTGDVSCGTCGTSNDPSRSFCRKCGSSLRPAPATSPSPEPRPAPAAAGSASRAGPPRPSLNELADYLTAYVPTWVVSLFLPLWGALIATEAGGTEFGQPFKLAIAVATAVTAALWVWSEGYRAARIAATKGRRRARVRPFDALRVGAWEVVAAAIAAFAWTTAAPSSWASFSTAFWPLATVIGAAVILGVAGNFLAPLEGER
jgi:hypothetical protein